MLGFKHRFRTSKARRRERARRVVWLALTGAFCLAGLVGFWWLGQQPFWHIDAVRVEGAAAIAADEIEAVANEQLDGAYFGLVPRRVAPFAPLGEIAGRLGERFPRLTDIDVSREGLTELAIHVREREPTALWCGDVAPIIFQPGVASDERALAHGTCYFMDDEAFLFAEAPDFSGDPFPRFYGAIGSGDVLGQRFLPQSEYDEALELMRVLDEQDVPASALLVVDEAEQEIYLSRGIRVLFSSEETAQTLARRLSRVLASEAFQAETTPIEYIDLRFGNKVYYKARER